VSSSADIAEVFCLTPFSPRVDFNSSQFAAIRSAHIFSVQIYDGLTAVLLGGLYLIWCDADIETNSVETLVLVLVYVFFIKNFVTDYCHSIDAIEIGKGSLEKLKVRSIERLKLSPDVHAFLF
jgi:hypothetical protein